MKPGLLPAKMQRIVSMTEAVASKSGSTAKNRILGSPSKSVSDLEWKSGFESKSRSRKEKQISNSKANLYQIDTPRYEVRVAARSMCYAYRGWNVLGTHEARPECIVDVGEELREGASFEAVVKVAGTEREIYSRTLEP
jgi:hypothetical protein